MSQPDQVALSNHVPQAPRPLTARARRRSWNELPVRVWVLLTLAMALATSYVTVIRIRTALDDRWLIQHGTLVHAKIVAANGATTPKRWPRNEPIPAEVEFNLSPGQTTHLSITLDAKPDAFAPVGGEIVIKVDPNDPQRWTEQDTPLPWSHELVVPAMLTPVVVLLAIVTLARRSGVLSTWREGALAQGVVVQTHHSAVAPSSRVVRFTLENGDGRIWNMLMPVKIGIPDVGQAFWLICNPNNPGGAIPAGAYVDALPASSLK